MTSLLKSLRGRVSPLMTTLSATAQTMTEPGATMAVQAANPSKRVKLTGRAFYESIGSPKMIVAPMVDRSEFAWRLLTRSYLDEERSKSLLAYTPMLHARLFKEQAKFRDMHFQPTRESLVSTEKASSDPWLDGNPNIDRPLFVQFCANKPDDLLEAARYVSPYCDAVDLNLGCPQGIAKNGHYGAFLQEDWGTISKMIEKLDVELDIPITAKMRILDTKEKTLDYAKMILSAGASILTVHGRRREQKGHNMGVADWAMIRYLRDNLPPETVLFANGNILNSDDLEPCLEATGVDGIMSAEGNLSDPTIFALPPKDPASREYWIDSDGKGGYRIDGVFRRYMDIIYEHVLGRTPPLRQPLYVPSDPPSVPSSPQNEDASQDGEPPRKKRKKDAAAIASPSLKVMQGHLFQVLRPLLSTHTNIRDTLAKTRAGDMEAFEKLLSMVEDAIRTGIREDAAKRALSKEPVNHPTTDSPVAEMTPSQRTIARYKRPWWVCQPHIRPLPEEALAIGAITISKKEQAKAEMEKKMQEEKGVVSRTDDDKQTSQSLNAVTGELPQTPALVCG